MVVAQALLKSEEIFNDVLKIVDSPFNDQLAIRRYKSELKKLISTGVDSVSFCYAALGLLDVIEKDQVGAISNLNNAVRLSPNDVSVMHVRSVVFRKLGLIKEAMKASFETIAIAPGDKNALHEAIICAQRAGMFSKASELIGRYANLTVNDSKMLLQKFQAHNKFVLAKIAERGIDEETIIDRIEVAKGVIEREGYFVSEVDQLFLHDGTFFIHFYVDQEQDTCAHLNFLIADELVEKFDDVYMELFNIKCRPFAIYSQTQSLYK